MMKIGQKIKYFREKMGVTQGHLAEILNVSTQAVSKWETSSAYPDITLLPIIAEYFNVSCDALLTDSGKTEKEIVEGLLAEAERQDVTTKSGYFARVAALEDALERYPRSCRLMLELAYLYSAGIGELGFEMQGRREKIIEYCERVCEKSDVLREKYDAMTLLCYTYSGTDNERIIELAKQMPEIYQSRPALVYHGYEGEKKYEGMYDYFSELLDTSHSILCCLIGGNRELDEMYRKIKDFASNREMWPDRQIGAGE
ncbi:MAG: helix-turn-helix transcriptional regulator [Clostridia bacterium]|nr:helix-turn-helix transcriptional regulator [Clostridia bacterium]